MRFLSRRSTAPAVEERPTRLWSPAQPVALALGGVAIAFGVVALTRTDLDLSHVTRGHAQYLGFWHTPLLGLAEVGFGVFMLLAGIGPVIGRSIMTLLGAAATGLGIVVAAGWWSTKMTHWLGVTDRSGWLFIAVGGFALLVAFFAPVLTIGGPRVVEATVPDTAAAETTTVATPKAGPDATTDAAPEPKPTVPPHRPGPRDKPRVAEPSNQ
jgi:hypothetical protein